MIVINTIDDRKFSLNGIPYLRNYISAVYGTSVEVFNCYERHDVLVEQTHFNQFRVNGTSYSAAAALQTALLDVIYSRNTMGGIIPDQDNIDIRKYFLYNESYTSTQILAEINGLANYTVNEKQSVWFIGRNFQLLQPVPVGGVLIPPSRDSAPPVLSASSVVKYKMLNKGKGVYGNSGIQLTWDDLELVYQNILTENDISQYPETDIIDFGELGTQEIHEWLNGRTPAITIQPQNEGYTLFKGTASGEPKSYLWVGEASTYGASNPTATINDFEILEDAPPAPYIPGQDEVTANGNIITNNEHRFIKVEEGTEVQTHAVDENGQYFKKGEFTVTERYADPVANVEYIKPAKPANDVYVMQSDLKQQQLKVIDSYVTDSLYTIVEEDFGKT